MYQRRSQWLGREKASFRGEAGLGNGLLSLPVGHHDLYPVGLAAAE